MTSILNITPAARLYIESVLKAQNASILEIGVNGKGCNGMSYTFEIAQPQDQKVGDEIINLGTDMQVVVPAECVMYLLGSTVDHENTMWQNRLVVNNPQATSKCGCGTSFSVE